LDALEAANAEKCIGVAIHLLPDLTQRSLANAIVLTGPLRGT
jgi:hypothetical protein